MKNKSLIVKAFIPLLKKSKGGRIAITKSISEELILRWGNTQIHKTALNSYLEQLEYVSYFSHFLQNSSFLEWNCNIPKLKLECLSQAKKK